MASLGDTLVGRSAELETLGASLDALDADGPACVAVAGEPGIGKTRLLGELRSLAEDRGYIVLHGRRRSSSATGRSAS